MQLKIVSKHFFCTFLFLFKLKPTFTYFQFNYIFLRFACYSLVYLACFFLYVNLIYLQDSRPSVLYIWYIQQSISEILCCMDGYIYMNYKTNITLSLARATH